MVRTLLVVGVVLAVSAVVSAHLCNDVFVQAKDNLAVKVDIRDGQLRIGKSAKFRVYLLNTMDRDIVVIALQVRGEQFDAKVTPTSIERLRTAKSGGTKKFFEVELTRKPGVPDGRYQIGLHLFNPKRPSQVFKTVDLAAAANLVALPKAGEIAVDGNTERAEWGKAALCTNFYSYEQVGRYCENRTARDQARFYMAADKDYIYCSLGFLGGDGAQADEAALHVARTYDDDPTVIRIDRVKGSLSSPRGTEGIQVKASNDRKTVECRIPRKLLGIGDANTFFFNFTRSITRNGRKSVTYWKGNDLSMDQPIAFAQATIEN